MFSRSLVLATLVFLSFVLARGQERFTPCTPAEKFIAITVSAKTIAGSDNTPSRNIWTLVGTPGPDRVVVPGDDVLKARIMELMQEIVDSGAELGVGKGGNPEPGDPPQLELFLADLDSVRPGFQLVLPAELTSPPRSADLGHNFTVHLCLKYEAPTIPSSVQIEIQTLAAAQGTTPRIAKTFQLADAKPDLVNTFAGNIRVNVSYAAADLQDAKRDPAVNTDQAADQRLKTELLSVAARAFDEAIAKGLLSAEGKPLFDRFSGNDVAQSVQDALTSRYSLNGFEPLIDWAKVRVRVGVIDLSPNSPWKISITDLQLSQRIDIEVVKNQKEIEYQDDQSADRKFVEKRRKVREKLIQDHLNSFSARPGRILTTEQIKADQETLSSDKDVSSLERVRSEASNQDLVYPVTRRMKDDKELATKLGVGYSPEEHFTGTIAFDETNFLGFAEKMNLGYEGGPQVQKIRFNLQRLFNSSDTQGWRIRLFDLNVQYFTDKDTRFGNLTPDEVAAREAGSAVRFSIAYDSFSILDHSLENCFSEEGRKRTRLYLVANPLLAYRDVNIREDEFLSSLIELDKSLLPRSRTQVTTLSLDVNAGLRHDFRDGKRAGLGVFNLSMQSGMARSFEAFGADYRFNKLRALVSADLSFGTLSSKDFFVRYNRNMSTSTPGTPLFELGRLGGPLTVRGLEEGEFIGRKLSADQFELGINALVLWHVVTRKPVEEMLLRDCLDESTSGLPFDVSNAYLKVFYDLGRVHDQDSFVNPIARTARGYGIALELRQMAGKNVNLSIGYAYSPDSALHKSGTVYTGVSYTF